jgi:membrane protease YdiL (CAAX protease family)
MSVDQQPTRQRGASLLPFTFKPAPVVFAVVLAFGLPFLAEHLALAVEGGRSGALPKQDGQLLAFLYLQHGLQAALSLAAILGLRRLINADFGLRWPDSLRSVAVAGGLSFAIFAAFTLVAYLPNILSQTAPLLPHPLNARSVAGWSFFQGVFVGPTEEILFRSLLIGYLATALPGAIRVGRLTVSWAVVIAAILFGLAHLPGNLGAPWWRNLFSVTYACALGLVYGYWFERSRSVLVPAIAHNITDLAALLTAFALAAP